MVAFSKTVYECSPLRSVMAGPRGRPESPAGPPDPGQGRRPLAHQILHLHRQGESDLRPGLRRYPRGERREGNSASSPRRSRPTTTPWSRSSSCSTTSTPRPRSAPMAMNGRWAPMRPTSSSGPGRSRTGATAGSLIRPKGALAIARPAGGYHLGPRGGEGADSYRSYGEFIRERQDTPADPSTTKVAALQGHFDPKFRGYDLSYPDVKTGRPVPRRTRRMREGGRRCPT